MVDFPRPTRQKEQEPEALFTLRIHQRYTMEGSVHGYLSQDGSELVRDKDAAGKFDILQLGMILQDLDFDECKLLTALIERV